MSQDLSPELEALRAQVRRFVDERILPVEDRIHHEDVVGSMATLRALQAEARDLGLWVPHLPPEVGGLGLGILGMCALFREMGRSPVGARVFNCDAPDQGNMDLLLRTASDSVRDRWLRPLIEGETTSAFCMTEPAPGAGADPSNLRTTATREGQGWRIDGHKWYSTGGRDAAFLIVMARTSADPRTGATMFVVDRHAPGVRYLRDIPVMSPPMLQHREGEFAFEGVYVDDDAVLGGVGQGFALAQARLVPARLTHCMRWLGWADRALAMCREYLDRRVSFGQKLGAHQAVQTMIARNAMGIYQGNLMTWDCARRLAAGDAKGARVYSSMAKLHVARLLCQVFDDAIQMHGGLGYSDDLPFARWYTFARSARIADGPDEVHQMVVAREFLADRVGLLG